MEKKKQKKLLYEVLQDPQKPCFSWRNFALKTAAGLFFLGGAYLIGTTALKADTQKKARTQMQNCAIETDEFAKKIFAEPKIPEPAKVPVISKPAEQEKRMPEEKKLSGIEEKKLYCQKLALRGMPEYNSLLDIIAEVWEETGTSPEYPAIVALIESRGRGGQRYEPGFQQKYIEKFFASGKKNRFTMLFRKLQKKDPKLTEEEFKRQLSTSTGPMQVMYATAVDKGYRGSFKGLAEPKTNIEIAVNLWGKLRTLEKILRKHNTGSANGKLYPGYDERRKYWQKKLVEQYFNKDTN